MAVNAIDALRAVRGDQQQQDANPALAALRAVRGDQQPANESYNQWAKQRGLPTSDSLMADVVPDQTSQASPGPNVAAQVLQSAINAHRAGLSPSITPQKPVQHSFWGAVGNAAAAGFRGAYNYLDKVETGAEAGIARHLKSVFPGISKDMLDDAKREAKAIQGATGSIAKQRQKAEAESGTGAFIGNILQGAVTWPASILHAATQTGQSALDSGASPTEAMGKAYASAFINALPLLALKAPVSRMGKAALAGVAGAESQAAQQALSGHPANLAQIGEAGGAMALFGGLAGGREAPKPAEVPEPTATPVEPEPTATPVELEPTAPPKGQAERRSDYNTRRKVGQMTPEERAHWLLTDELTGLPNKRALNEAPPAPVYAYVDGDNMRFVNNHMGHDAGDQMIAQIGSALKGAGLDAYHVSGDEFIIRGKNPEDLQAALSRAQEVLGQQKVEARGIVHTPQFSWGIAKTRDEADARMQAHKVERAANGQRVASGEIPAEQLPEKKAPTAAERAHARLRPNPEKDDLITFLRKHGGLNAETDEISGRLTHLNENNKTVGLKGIEQHGKDKWGNPKGLSLDHAAELATEAGYIAPGKNGSVDVRNLLDALHDAESGKRIFSHYNHNYAEQIGAPGLEGRFAELEALNPHADIRPEDYDEAAAEPGNEAADSAGGRHMAALVSEGRKVLGDRAVEQISAKYDSDDDKFMAALQEAIDAKQTQESGIQNAGQGERISPTEAPSPTVGQGPESATQAPIEIGTERHGVFNRRNLPGVESVLRALRKRRAIDRRGARLVLKEAVAEGLTPKIDRHIMDYREQAYLPPEQRTLTLTPKEQYLDQKYYEPMREELQHSPGYVPREAIGKGGAMDRRIAKKQAKPGVGIMRRRLPSMKRRTFKAMTDENGNRRVISIESAGKGVRATAYENGNAEKLGLYRRTDYEQFAKEQTASIDREITNLTREKRLLTATKSRTESSPVRLRNIDRRLKELQEERDAALESIPFQNGTFFSHKGTPVQIGEATANEIERHTGVRFHRSYLAKLADEWVSNRQVQRQAEVFDRLKSLPEFQDIATQDITNAPRNWKTVHLQEFQNYKAEPYTAEVLNRYGKMVRGEGRVPLLGPINTVLKTAMFSIMPAWHDLNILNIWAITRGITGFGPRGTYRFFRTLIPAMQEVSGFGDKYLRILSNGGPLLYLESREGLLAPEDFNELTKSVVDELATRPEHGPLLKALGYTPKQILRAGKWWGRHAQTSLWWFNDVAIMQRVLELEKYRKMDERAAVERVSETMPTYRLPEGYPVLNFLTHPDVSWFARYHLGLFKAYAKMVRRVVTTDPNIKPRDRLEAIDQLIMAGITTFVLYPVVDAALQEATGNPKAHMERFGLSRIPYDLVKIGTGQEGLVHFLAKQFTPAPGSYEFLQQGLNRDFWTGDQIAPFYESAPEQIAKRFAHLTNVNIPLENMVQAGGLGSGIARQFGVYLPESKRERMIQAIRENRERRQKERAYFKAHGG